MRVRELIPGPVTFSSTLEISLACVVPASAALAVLVSISPFGLWVFTGVSAKVALAVFLVSASVLGAVGGGATLWVAMRLLDALYRMSNASWLIVAACLATLSWLGLTLVASTPRHPIPLILFAFGLSLVAVAARGARPWRRSDVFVLVSASIYWLIAPALAEVFALGDWINDIIYVVPGTDPMDTYINAFVWVSTYAVVALGILPGRSLEVVSRVPERARATRRVVLASVTLVSAMLIVPAFRLASSFGEISGRPVRREAGLEEVARVVDSGRVIDSPPNVVLISLDTLRADHLSIYGYHRKTSPNVDRFFADAAVFVSSYSQSPWTLPSHMSMITGQNVSSHGSRVHPRKTRGYYVDGLPDSAVTIAETLQARGYATGGFTGGGYLDQRYGFDQGFDTFSLAQSTRIEEALDSALPWLREVRGRPFFLFLHCYDIHRYDPPRFFEEISDEGYHGPLRGVVDVWSGQIEWMVNQYRFHDLTDDDLRFIQYLYDSEIRGVDEQLQRLFDELEHGRGLEHTVVILTSDHGENFAEHDDLGHGKNMYETVIRVPLLVSAPGFRSGVRIDSVAQTIDVAPTILDLVGASPHPGMDGVSLVPALSGLADADNAVIIEADVLDTQAALILDGFKYVGYGYPPHNPLNPRFRRLSIMALLSYFRHDEALYDIRDDPDERHNLAQLEPARTRRYSELLTSTIRDLRSGANESPDDEAEPMSEELQDRLRSLGYIQ